MNDRERKFKGLRGGKTYGGRKYCSNTTHMPRAISPIRKYLPALSKADSLLSSHLSLRGRRKPEGGGPAGIAARVAEEENGAARKEGPFVRGEMRAVTGRDIGRVRASTVRGLIEAMLLV